MIKSMNGKDFDREFEESTAKRWLEEYKDFRKLVIPIMIAYSKKIKDVHKSTKITAMIEACEILNKQLNEYFSKKRKYTTRELEEKNDDFYDMMTNLQYYYQTAIIDINCETEKEL